MYYSAAIPIEPVAKEQLNDSKCNFSMKWHLRDLVQRFQYKFPLFSYNDYNKAQNITLLLSSYNISEVHTFITDDDTGHAASMTPQFFESILKLNNEHTTNVKNLLEWTVGSIMNHMTDPDEAAYFDYNRWYDMKSISLIVE